MTRNHKEQGIPSPIKERLLRSAFEGTIRKSEPLFKSPLLEELNSNCPSPGQKLLEVFGEAVSRKQAVVFFGAESYDQHMQAASRTAGFERPFGIELSTLSPNLKLVLFPHMIFKPSDEDRQMALEEGYEVATEGPQAMIYILDGFLDDPNNSAVFTANFFLFIPRVVAALLHERYSLVQGECSSEFATELKEAFALVGRYVRGLDQTSKDQLSPQILVLGDLDESKLDNYATCFVRYQTEAMKPTGLIESSAFSPKRENPEDAMQRSGEYLHLTDRYLPKRPRGLDTPSSPWVEYATNRYNRSYELFGRYEAEVEGVIIRVDYKLDTTHFPGKYGFFDTLEIIKISPSGKQHIILGQEVGHPLDPLSVFPISVAGDFDFSDEKALRYLMLLANDKGTKREIAGFLKDTLKLSAEGKLQRLKI